MHREIYSYIDNLFENGPKTKAARDLREELTANCTEKYDDLVAQGIPSGEAFEMVVSNIGNVEDLFMNIWQEPIGEQEIQYQKWQRLSAMRVTIAVGMYILAGLCIISTGLISYGSEDLVIFLGFALCLPATCILVYNHMTCPRYQVQDETLVEDFRAYSRGVDKEKAMQRALSSLLWTTIVVIYFIINFFTGAWHISWIIFLVGSCLQGALRLAFVLKQ